MASILLTALDELNVLTADDLLTALTGAYLLGITSAAAMLDTNLSVELDAMREVIYAVIDGKTFEDRAAEHIQQEQPGRLRTLAESEYHRVYNAALLDGARQFRSRTGQAVTKTWGTMLDDRVRDTHDYLEGVTVDVDDDFYTFDGDHAPCPGGFHRVENNAGCRCGIVLNSKTF